MIYNPNQISVSLKDIKTNVEPDDEEKLYTNGLYFIRGITTINQNNGELMIEGVSTTTIGIRVKGENCYWPVFRRGAKSPLQQFKTLQQIRNEKIDSILNG
jgi:hypothetical protein